MEEAKLNVMKAKIAKDNEQLFMTLTLVREYANEQFNGNVEEALNAILTLHTILKP